MIADRMREVEQTLRSETKIAYMQAGRSRKAVDRATFTALAVASGSAADMIAAALAAEKDGKNAGKH